MVDLRCDFLRLGRLSSLTTKATLEMNRRRAYSPDQFERLAAESAFGACDLESEGISLGVWLQEVI